LNTDSPQLSPSKPALLQVAAPAILLLAAGTTMAWWTWGTWPDVFIDFGRELYLAWQLSTGKVLYRDLAYYNGPLSPYLNSVWFRLFGVGLRTLIWCNLVILGFFVALLFSYLCRLADRLAATVTCMVFILLFPFSQYVGIGNYNYVCPYSHDAVHGLVLSFLTLFLLEKYRSERRAGWLAGAGFCSGLVFLTRSEIFVALAVAVISAPGLRFVLSLPRPTLVKRTGRVSASRQRGERDASTPAGGNRHSIRSTVTFVLPMLLPVVVAFVALSGAMPLNRALRGTLGAWPATLGTRVSSLRFFRFGMGLEDVATNIRTMLIWSTGYLAVFVPLFILASIMRKPGLYRVAITFLLGTLGAVAMAWAGWEPPPYDPARPLPFLMALVCVFLVWRLISSAPSDTDPAIAGLPLCIFGLALLGKMILLSRITQVGFYLAIPSVLVVVLVLVKWIPSAVDRRGGFGWLFRGAAIGILSGVIITYIHASAGYSARKTETIGVGADQFLGDYRGAFANVALEQIQQLMNPQETLVVLPEGVMLNYLSRRVNPTPHTNFMPTEMVIFGEASMLESLKENPPDWIAFVHKDTSEFGYRFFGVDYARSIREWVNQNYRLYITIGAAPLEERRKFGVALWKRQPTE